MVAADAAGGLAFAATGLFMALPYLRVEDADPAAVTAARGLAQVKAYSPDWSGLVSPPAIEGTWSWITGGATLTEGTNEARLLPGVVLIVLALGGLLLSSWRLRWRAALLAAVLGTGALALGSTLSVAGFTPFLWLRGHAPGWESDRTPGRIITFTTLALALLAAGFVTKLVRRRQASGAPSGREPAGRLRLAAAALLPLLVLTEGYGPIETTPVPAPPRAVREAPGPLVVLPSIWTFDSRIMYWTAVTGFPGLGNGQSGITPGSLKYMRAQLLQFPDEQSAAYLRANGFRSVVVLKQDIGAQLWGNAGRVPPPGLGLTRTDYGDAVLFTVDEQAS